MTVKIIHECDLCGGIATSDKKKIPVIFETEQTEGRFCEPHLTFENLDLCPFCYQTIIDKIPVRATGAQGINTYRWWKKDS